MILSKQTQPLVQLLLIDKTVKFFLVKYYRKVISNTLFNYCVLKNLKYKNTQTPEYTNSVNFALELGYFVEF